MKPKTRPMPPPSSVVPTDPLQVRSGPSIVPHERVKLFSPAEWEEFVNEWTSSLGEYGLVERTGGTGDLGCDVVATVDPHLTDGPWDNYQCKHYDHPLTPSDVWIEVAKACYHTLTGAYTLPRAYYFVGPCGVGTKLARLLKKPDEFKAELLRVWPSKCAPALIKGKIVPLDAPLKAHIDSIDFRIFQHVPPLTLIEGHAKTRFFAVRFGGGLPPRPPSPLPPASIASNETRYVQQLLEAYGDHLKCAVTHPRDLEAPLGKHFTRARESFYCAESLRNFSRDTLPGEAFEHLQQQIFDGVIDICESTHPSGFDRVKATTSQAAKLELTSSALLGRVDIADRHGVCHQLANDDRLTWVPK